VIDINEYRDPQSERTRYGRVYTGDYESNKKPDVVINMNAETFDSLSRKETNGFMAFVKGRLTFNGNLATLKKFDKHVADKYLYNMEADVY
jgi:putative sterol carrier protein